MLTYDDEPTIRHAIMRRLEAENGVKVFTLLIRDHKDFIKAGVGCTVGAPSMLGTQPLITEHLFELPVPFEHSHLINEIDEICEKIKEARKRHFLAGSPSTPRQHLPGTGLRGRWAQYGLKHA